MAGLWSNHLCSYQRSALARPNAPSGCQTNFTSLHKVIGISEKTKKPQWLVVYILQNTLGLKPVKCVFKKAHRGGLDRLNLYLHADWVNQCMTMQTKGMWQKGKDLAELYHRRYEKFGQSCEDAQEKGKWRLRIKALLANPGLPRKRAINSVCILQGARYIYRLLLLTTFLCTFCAMS